jgi:phospholipid/cholesterol/gamma-HCH transport system ATP-binding protein
METAPAIHHPGKKAISEPVIVIRNLCKSFGNNHVLKNFNLELHHGENLIVLGKSGSGKSVLIKCIIGLIKPDEGSITVFGKEIIGLDHEAMDKMRVKVGFLFQSNALYDSMTIRENLEFPLRRHGKEKTREEIDALVTGALAQVGLAHTIDMTPSELSGGMRKRVALARTLILEPEIILYDEPTTGLDPITGREISQLMVQIQQKYNTSSLIISHDVNCVKITSNRVVLLVDGAAYATGTWSELSASADPKVKQFFT